jgi:hypothetical protein
MWPLRARGGTAQCNPARPTAGLTGEDVERGLGVPRTRFVGLIGGREPPGGRGRRSKAAGAAGARAPARGQRGQGNTQVWELD